MSPDVDGLVDQTVRDLVGEHERRGELDRATVDRLLLKRGLTATQCDQTDDELASRGIVIAETIPTTVEEGYADRGTVAPTGDTALSGMMNHPLLTPDREVELGTAIQLGKRARQEGSSSSEAQRILERAHEARQELIANNLRFVMFVAKSMPVGVVQLEDLVMEGTVGLIIAAGRFSPNFGARFQTYAVWWIRQSMMSAIEKQGRLVRVPANVHRDIIHLNRAKRFLRSIGAMQGSSVAKLSAALGWPADRAAFILHLSEIRTLSLDASGAHEGAPTLGEMIPATAPSPEDYATAAEEASIIESCLEELPDPRMREIIIRRFELDLKPEETLEDIGERLGITRERVRQIQERALKILAKRLAHLDPVRGDNE